MNKLYRMDLARRSGESTRGGGMPLQTSMAYAGRFAGDAVPSRPTILVSEYLFRRETWPVRYGKVVHKWKSTRPFRLHVSPKTKFAPNGSWANRPRHQSRNAPYRVDPRFSGQKSVHVQLKQYVSRNDFRTPPGLQTESIGVGSIRLTFASLTPLGINAKTHNYPPHADALKYGLQPTPPASPLLLWTRPFAERRVSSPPASISPDSRQS